MKAKNCKRCKGKGWLKWYRDREGRASFANDVILYYFVGKRVMRYLPVCPCTLRGVKYRDGVKVLLDESVRSQEYTDYQGGVSVETIALKSGHTAEQMKIRLCWYASYKLLPLRESEIVFIATAFYPHPTPMYNLLESSA